MSNNATLRYSASKRRKPKIASRIWAKGGKWLPEDVYLRLRDAEIAEYNRIIAKRELGQR